MTAEDILQALHQAAMGRARTPQQIELAEKLAAVFAREADRAEAAKAGEELVQTLIDSPKPLTDLVRRRKKAD